jgi:hypothetical protein
LTIIAPDSRMSPAISLLPPLKPHQLAKIMIGRSMDNLGHLERQDREENLTYWESQRFSSRHSRQQCKNSTKHLITYQPGKEQAALSSAFHDSVAVSLEHAPIFSVVCLTLFRNDDNPLYVAGATGTMPNVIVAIGAINHSTLDGWQHNSCCNCGLSP